MSALALQSLLNANQIDVEKLKQGAHEEFKSRQKQELDPDLPSAAYWGEYHALEQLAEDGLAEKIWDGTPHEGFDAEDFEDLDSLKVASAIEHLRDHLGTQITDHILEEANHVQSNN